MRKPEPNLCMGELCNVITSINTRYKSSGDVFNTLRATAPSQKT